MDARLLALLPPEERLLALAAGAPPDATLTRAAAEVADWPRLLARAERERAVGALWRRLAAAGVPEAAPLRPLALVEGFRGERQRQRLVAALRALHAEGIPVVLLKGAALAASVYPRWGDRAMSDLDVLLRPEDAGRAWRVLVADGWTPDAGEVPAGSWEEHHHLMPLRDPAQPGLVLEPHVALFGAGHPFAFEAADVWREARPAIVDGATALVPSPVHLALHACLHLTWSHALASGGWRTLRDLGALASSGVLDCEAFVTGARAAGAASCCYWPLALGRALGAVEVPDAVLRRLRPAAVAAGAGRVLLRHFALQLFAPATACPSRWLRRALWAAGTSPRGRGGRGEASRARPWSRDEAFVRPAAGAAGEGRASWGPFVRALAGRPARTGAPGRARRG